MNTKKIFKDRKYEFVVQGNYGQGWEDVTSEEKHYEAQERLKEYNDNESYPHRIVRKRVQDE